MTGDDSAEWIATAARHLQESQDDVEATLQSAVHVTQVAIEGCDAAGLSMVKSGKVVKTLAATDDMVRAVDDLQYELEEGPCLDAMWRHVVVRSRDLGRDERWPTWGPRVVEETDARSMLSFRLFTNSNRLGALNLYSTSPDAFDDLALAEGVAIAAQVSMAVAAAQKLDIMSQGLVSRTVIGQATGILMERYDLDPVRAFSVLSRMSNEGNIKIRVLSAQIVEHRAESREGGLQRPEDPPSRVLGPRPTGQS
ncbi:GAF and ANTAR domain-containing protein [Nocardioides KLBMP 9356]|uniref:GAF and ANTAR domain-containing protein n=1 Tax=Nocardioides potassii TaxID=2911371 RepID=A0ABS9HDP3_9ACTN|nr:GAF and ANTAR domain-containing protein [Nocardioides potassii]MCF6379315.1 GAF and ANTAR domain-containing protein [Nocardioides potassii]